MPLTDGMVPIAGTAPTVKPPVSTSEKFEPLELPAMTEIALFWSVSWTPPFDATAETDAAVMGPPF